MNNCSFCTGVLPYSVLVEICVAKARWDSALDDGKISATITVQRQPLVAVPTLNVTTLCLIVTTIEDQNTTTSTPSPPWVHFSA